MTKLDQEIHKFIKKMKRRKTLEKWFHYVAIYEMVAVFFAFVLSVIALFVPIYGSEYYGFGLLAVGIAASLVHLLLKLPDEKEAALYGDRAGLQERLTTSVELYGKEDSFSLMQKRDTLAKLEGFSIKERLPIRWDRKYYTVIISVLILFSLCSLVTTEAKNEAQIAHELAEAIEKEEEEIDKALEELEKQKEAGEISEEEFEKLKNLLEQSKAELTEADDEEDVKKAMERLEDKLKVETADLDSTKALESLQSLAGDYDLKAANEYNKALEQMAQKSDAIKQAQSELQSLGELLDEKEKQELIQKLDSQMQNGELTTGELSETLNSLGDASAQMAAASISESAQSGNQSKQTGQSGEGNGSQSGQSVQQSQNQNGNQGQNGQGQGSGSGSGQGQGQGQGQGAGSGNGQGGGQNTGSAKGIEREGKNSKTEEVYVTGKEFGEDENLQGKGSDGKLSSEKVTTSGGWSGSKANLDSVVGSYSEEAYSKVDSNEVPASMKDVVKNYFTDLNN